MKRSINNWIFVFLSLFLVSGCAQKDAANEQPTEIILVETEGPAQTLPISAEEKIPAPNTPVAPSATPAQKTAASSPVSSKTAEGSSLDVEKVITTLKNWDKKLNFLTTHFEQISSYDGVQISRSQGTLRYDKKHDFLRLDTLDNKGVLEQSAYTDKQKILIFDESGHQVTNLSWKEWQQGQPNQALFDFGNYSALLDRHHVKLQQEQQRPVLVLTPKEGEDYTLYLTLDKNDYFPTSIKIVSDLMVTQSDLTQTDKTTPIANTTFGGLFK